MRHYYVYILSNATNKVVYTGVTNDLIRRVHQHKEHIDPDSFTAKYHVDRLVYYEEYGDVRDAIDREKQIKSWNRKRKNDIVSDFNPEWVDLFESIIQ